MKSRAGTGKIDIHAIVGILREEVRDLQVPIVTEISRKRREPFDILISTILSLRTKDEVTREASLRLLKKGYIGVFHLLEATVCRWAGIPIAALLPDLTVCLQKLPDADPT